MLGGWKTMPNGCKVFVEPDGTIRRNKIKEKDIVDSFLDIQIKEILGMSDDELYVLIILASIGKEVEINILLFLLLVENMENIENTEMYIIVLIAISII